MRSRAASSRLRRTPGQVRRRAACLVALIALPVGIGACWGGDEAVSGADERGSVAGARVELRSAASRNSTVAADSLANTRIGGPYGTVLAFRFRAQWTGAVRSVRFFAVLNDGGSGYSGGTGGTLRVALAPDARGRRHVPARRSLASATVDPPSRSGWPLVRFSNSPRVVAGRYYHVVFTNLDPDPESNYISVNALVSYGHRGRAPGLPDGMAVLLADARDGGRTPGRWHPRAQRRGDRYAPILEVTGDRPGRNLGVGYMEVWVSNPKPIGGGAKVRQLISPAANKAITGAWLRVRRRGPTSAPLELRIERAGGGVLASAGVAARDVPSAHPGWVHVRFPRAIPFEPGERLALTAAANAGSAYEAFPVRKGTEFGFDRRTVFDGGYAQFTQDGGWIGWDQWGGHDQHNGDLQFALDTVPR